MRTVEVEELSLEAFSPFGFVAGHLNPSAEKIGGAPVEFFRDMAQLDLGSANRASFSTCRVAPRDFVVDVTEYHSKTGEGVLPLDGDVLVHVGVATTGAFPVGAIRVFRVPRGTLVVLRPGVWHHAPFAVGGQPVNVLIVLPERTYANDCTVVNLEANERIRIAFG